MPTALKYTGQVKIVFFSFISYDVMDTIKKLILCSLLFKEAQVQEIFCGRQMEVWV